MLPYLTLVVVVVGAACGRVSFERLVDDAVVPDGQVDAVEVDAIADAMIDADFTNVGCMDGEREAFVDPLVFPNIAGCAATWSGAVDLAAIPIGLPCGDDLGDCLHPRHACVGGWHPCADGGNLAELLVVTSAECRNAAAGRFVAAVSHASDTGPCVYTAPSCRPAALGAQPVCCGTACDVPSCAAGVWNPTYQAMANGDPCAAFSATSITGILCCRS